jgi:MFS family permease
VFARLIGPLGLRGVRRRSEVDDRVVVLAVFGRFVDELASGLLLVLLPTVQARLGLSVTQVGWLLQAIDGAAAVVEPVTAAAVDITHRRPLLVVGALGWSAALLLVAGAPSYGWLLLAFVLVGMTSGALALTTDVLLVELHPGDEERIGARQTMLDTVGALLAPAAVAVTTWSGADPRLPLVVAGAVVLGYAGLLAATAMPDPPGAEAVVGDPARPARRAWHQLRSNAAHVARDREVRPWLLALFGEALMAVPSLFVPVWLAGAVGASQTAVAVHVGVELAASLVGLALVDRWLQRWDGRAILTASAIAALVTYPVWLLAPGIAAKVVLIVPVTLAVTPVWPLARARALTAVPGRGGATLAVTSLFGALPLAALVGWLGDRLGLAPVMLAMHTAAALLILVVVRRRPGGQ